MYPVKNRCAGKNLAEQPIEVHSFPICWCNQNRMTTWGQWHLRSKGSFFKTCHYSQRKIVSTIMQHTVPCQVYLVWTKFNPSKRRVWDKWNKENFNLQNKFHLFVPVRTVTLWWQGKQLFFAIFRTQISASLENLFRERFTFEDDVFVFWV